MNRQLLLTATTNQKKINKNNQLYSSLELNTTKKWSTEKDESNWRGKKEQETVQQQLYSNKNNERTTTKTTNEPQRLKLFIVYIFVVAFCFIVIKFLCIGDRQNGLLFVYVF